MSSRTVKCRRPITQYSSTDPGRGQAGRQLEQPLDGLEAVSPRSSWIGRSSGPETQRVVRRVRRSTVAGGEQVPSLAGRLTGESGSGDPSRTRYRAVVVARERGRVQLRRWFSRRLENALVRSCRRKRGRQGAIALAVLEGARGRVFRQPSSHRSLCVDARRLSLRVLDGSRDPADLKGNG